LLKILSNSYTFDNGTITQTASGRCNIFNCNSISNFDVKNILE